MLERLIIRDLALVERVEIEFGPGLHAVTGETGAGKSLMVQALALVVGGRADADIVREGAKTCVVEAEFRLAGETANRVRELLRPWDLDLDDDALIVRREVSSEGRSRAGVNQSSVTLANLKKLGEQLLDLHGQHEHQSLLRDGAALATLDRLAGLEPERARFAEALAALREAEGELARLRESLATFAERRDYLRSAAAELDEAKLHEGEEEALKTEAARLAHADRLRELVAIATQRLEEGDGAATSALAAARHAIEQAAAVDDSLAEALAQLSDAAIAAQEAARSLAAYLDRLEADPDRLEQVEARRDLYARLVRKYRRGVPELVAWREELNAELAQGETATPRSPGPKRAWPMPKRPVSRRGRRSRASARPRRGSGRRRSRASSSRSASRTPGWRSRWRPSSTGARRRTASTRSRSRSPPTPASPRGS